MLGSALLSTGIRHFPARGLFEYLPSLSAAGSRGWVTGEDAGYSEDQNFSFKEPYVLEWITGSLKQSGC